MKEKLEEIKKKGLEKIKNVKTIAELEEVRKELTGKNRLCRSDSQRYRSPEERISGYFGRTRSDSYGK